MARSARAASARGSHTAANGAAAVCIPVARCSGGFTQDHLSWSTLLSRRTGTCVCLDSRVGGLCACMAGGGGFSAAEVRRAEGSGLGERATSRSAPGAQVNLCLPDPAVEQLPGTTLCSPCPAPSRAALHCLVRCGSRAVSGESRSGALQVRRCSSPPPIPSDPPYLLDLLLLSSPPR